MRFPYIIILFALVWGLAFLPKASLAQPQAEANVGFRSLVAWVPGSGIKAEVGVWYPTARLQAILTVDNWTFPATRNAPPLPGSWPLLLISHDSLGSWLSHHDLAVNLAKQGYIVVAPTHEGDNLDDMSLLFTAAQLPTRAQQLSASLDLILSDPALGPLVDRSRIGLMGFGNGGTATLLMAGTRLSPEEWPGYCRSDQQTSPYCQPHMRRNMDQLIQSMLIQGRIREEEARNWELATQGRSQALRQANKAVDAAYPRVNRTQRRPIVNFPRTPVFLPVLPPLPQEPETYDPRIRGIILVSPGLTMLFERASLREITIPVVIMTAEEDAINRPEEQGQVLRQLISPSNRYYLMLEGADFPSLLATCPPDLATELPDLCNTVTPQKRAAIHQRLRDATLAYLQQIF